MALPHFGPMGAPDFISDASGVLTGLKLETTRAEILKGLLEGAIFSLRECVELLPGAGITINDYRAVGGGSIIGAWVQICADILNRPFVRPRITEAGALGAAIMAGTGTGIFESMEEGCRAMVRLEDTFSPNRQKTAQYNIRFEKYRRLWSLLNEFLRGR
ncbi:Xylulose kinase [subsurface metagenome]